MTVISDRVGDGAGLGETDDIVFAAAWLRDNATGTQIVNTRRFRYTPDEDGAFTTDDLDPGPYLVTVGVAASAYPIDVPDDADGPIRLWPLIEAKLPIPPEQRASAVINGGGIARLQKITESAFAALSAPDPETKYSVIPDPE